MERRNRISIIATVAALVAAPLVAAGQEVHPAHRVGILAHDLQPGLLETFRGELHKLGYAEGHDIGIELRNAAGQSARLPALADELLRDKVEVIVAINTPAAQAAKKVTRTIPIVVMRVADPVKSGLVASLAHPGGNVTGLFFMLDEFGVKGLETLRKIAPTISRVGILYRGDNPGAAIVSTATERRGSEIGLRFLPLPVRTPADIDDAFKAAVGGGMEALFVIDDGAMTERRHDILRLAATHALPVVSVYADFAEAGGLIAYGPNLTALYRRAAFYVDRILKGARPSDLPVEQPDNFDLVVNLKTARALGMKVPQDVLLRADRVIE